MQLIDYLYLIILSFCFISSLINETAKRENLWIYFFTVLISEIYTFFFQKKFQVQIYLYSGLIYNSYLIYYFFKNTKFWIYILPVHILITLFLILSSRLYSTLDSLNIISLYLLMSLYYYFSQIISVNEIPLQKKQKFWMATGLLIWSITYAFNVFPIFFLASIDMD